MELRTADFDYDLPESFIAQEPLEPRDAARLMVLHREDGRIEHRIFREIGEYLRPHDVLVLNQTRVLPARLFARKESGGRAEILLLRRLDEQSWECLVGGKGLKAGRRLLLSEALEATILEEKEGALRIVRFSSPLTPELLFRLGQVPLPPYIHRPLHDPERYQTVYARQPGSAAAPTAGLHFTPRLLQELQAQGIHLAYITLHIGLDTFAPVTEDRPTEHKIHTEWCEVDEVAVETIRAARAQGGRVIAVGTTSVRALESAATESGELQPYRGDTSLFILPGYRFKVVEAMITNFHLPRSTLLMLVSAFAGRERILSAYEEAKRHQYRFYSFGDAMLIL
ncbi:MAG: tRNA preQ1(34) S-adenosylmethionine ribosyltransferase-isomerase QueA [Chloroflexi bacterium]|jgi:S-adenosylmethionine:tRNA ribosyltransferase-isomerase|nr:tRNA preQ1(34) S-adenosylmethionine ribosyltransferase-isomerase QueA [Chloroflexota bacterium]